MTVRIIFRLMKMKLPFTKLGKYIFCYFVCERGFFFRLVGLRFLFVQGELVDLKISVKTAEHELHRKRDGGYEGIFVSSELHILYSSPPKYIQYRFVVCLFIAVCFSYSPRSFFLLHPYLLPLRVFISNKGI